MTGIYITARMGSSRLPSKHLYEAGGKRFIEWQLARFHKEFENEIAAGETSIFIVSSIKPENKKFGELLGPSHPYVSFFYGSDGNIPLRHLECAESNAIDAIIAIDGDDVLCSTSAARKIMDGLTAGAEMIKVTGLPLGLNSMGYTTKLLSKSLADYRTRDRLETGWGKVFDGAAITEIVLGNHDKDPRFRFTLDYIQDAEFFQKIIAHFGESIIGLSDDELIRYVLDKEVYLINNSLNDMFWENFYSQRNQE